MIKLEQSEIDIGKALTANIEAMNRNLGALLITEQIYIAFLRQKYGLSEDSQILYWEKGFEVCQQKQSTISQS